MTIGASTSRASGSTYFLALSFTYVTATSAPKARNALAQPHAIEFSLAMPTTRPRLPSSSLAFTVGIMGSFDEIGGGVRTCGSCFRRNVHCQVRSPSLRTDILPFASPALNCSEGYRQHP